MIFFKHWRYTRSDSVSKNQNWISSLKFWCFPGVSIKKEKCLVNRFQSPNFKISGFGFPQFFRNFFTNSRNEQVDLENIRGVSYHSFWTHRCVRSRVSGKGIWRDGNDGGCCLPRGTQTFEGIGMERIWSLGTTRIDLQTNYIRWDQLPKKFERGCISGLWRSRLSLQAYTDKAHSTTDNTSWVRDMFRIFWRCSNASVLPPLRLLHVHIKD